MSLKILSANCRGLNSVKKRTDVLNHLSKNYKYDVYYLQDTHFTLGMEEGIEEMWGGKCYTLVPLNPIQEA